jgi:hypothetical protein
VELQNLLVRLAVLVAVEWLVLLAVLEIHHQRVHRKEIMAALAVVLLLLMAVVAAAALGLQEAQVLVVVAEMVEMAQQVA